MAFVTVSYVTGLKTCPDYRQIVIAGEAQFWFIGNRRGGPPR